MALIVYKLNRLSFSIGILPIIILAVLFNIGVSILILSLPFTESIASVDGIDNLAQDVGPAIFFLIAVVFVPLFETVVFQAFIISVATELLRRRNIYKLHYPIIISSVAFSLIHLYSITYLLVTFFIGLCLAYTYVIVKKRKQKPILVVAIVHAIHNLIVFIGDYLT